MATIKSEVTSDAYGRTVVSLTKRRGKLTMGEMQDYLRVNMPGTYIIVLRAGEDNYVDWPVETEGDAQALFLLDTDCPVCGKELPTGYCPKCGADLNNEFMERL